MKVWSEQNVSDNSLSQDWIYRQICHSTAPVHPLLPPLIEVYIQSIILPSTKTDRTNEPIKDEEILAVFKETESVKATTLGKYQEKTGKGGKNSGRKGKDPSPKKKKVELPKSLQSESEHAGMPSKLLLLYYVLLYQETYVTNIKVIREFISLAWLAHFCAYRSSKIERKSLCLLCCSGVQQENSHVQGFYLV